MCYPRFFLTTHPTYCRRQYSFAFGRKPAKSIAQKALVQEKRNTLAIQIKRWRELQLVYMPGVEDPLPSMRDDDTDETESYRIEDIALTFPSGLEPTQRLTVCRDRVAEHEERFHLAQLQDSLVELHHIRRIHRTLITNHRLQISGQGRRANTRSRTVIDNIQECITLGTRTHIPSGHIVNTL